MSSEKRGVVTRSGKQARGATSSKSNGRQSTSTGSHERGVKPNPGIVQGESIQSGKPGQRNTKRDQGESVKSPRPNVKRNQRGSAESEKSAQRNGVKGGNDVIIWLDHLKDQIEKDEYNPNVLAQKTNGSEESVKISASLQELWRIIEKRSECQRDTLSKVQKLCSKLQEANDKLLSDSSKEKPSMENNGAAVPLKESKEEKNISTAISLAEQLIEQVETSRATRGISKQAANRKQDFQKQEIIQKTENVWKSKFAAVIDWLDKFQTQISESQYDENIIRKAKTLENLEGSHEEINKCHTIISDCCKKLKNGNAAKMSIDNEVKTLLNDIKNWDNVKEVGGEKDGSADKKVKDLQKGRLQLFKRKDDYKCAKGELACLTMELSDWGSVNAIAGKLEADCELASAIRANRLTILEKKKELQSNKKGDESSQKQNHEKAIKDLWVMIQSDNKTSRKLDIGNALDEITQYVKTTQKTIDETEAKEKLTRKEKESQNERIKDLWTIIHKGKSYNGIPEEALDEIKTCLLDLQKRRDEFIQIEGVAFKVEEKSNQIFSMLTGGNYSCTDSKYTLDTLNTILGLLERCLSETGSCVREIKTIEEVLNIKDNNTAISERCNVVMIKVKGVIEQMKQGQDQVVTFFKEKRWMKIYDETKSILDQSVQTLAESYSKLLVEPYYFKEPKGNETSIDKKSPDFLKSIEGVVNKIQICIEKNKDSFPQMFVSQQCFEKSTDKLNNQIKQLEAEKDSVYNRLSKVAGARLTDNNPNIADLSDLNRPTKLAEKYSELYDIQYTDAFETLNKKEKENTEFLLKIITKCYELCGEISRNHQQNLKRAMCFPVGKTDTVQTSKTTKKKADISFPAIQSKTLSDFRKQTAEISVVDVKSHIKSGQSEWFSSKKLENYTISCIELCWLMHVQTPPVVIETVAKSGSKFDTSRYRHYTKGGNKIDFVVWPALLLEEGGAILCRGVAQGK